MLYEHHEERLRISEDYDIRSSNAAVPYEERRFLLGALHTHNTHTTQSHRETGDRVGGETSDEVRRRGREKTKKTRNERGKLNAN